MAKLLPVEVDAGADIEFSQREGLSKTLSTFFLSIRMNFRAIPKHYKDLIFTKKIAAG